MDNLLKYLSTAPVLATVWMVITAGIIIEFNRFFPDLLFQKEADDLFKTLSPNALERLVQTVRLSLCPQVACVAVCEEMCGSLWRC